MTIATAKQAQSVVGKTEHVSWLKWPFRVYNRYIYDQIPNYKDENQSVIVTQSIKYAMQQWIHALKLVGPAKLQFLVHPPQSFDYVITTDGSDIGYGGFEGSSYFFDRYYPQEVNPNNIKNIKDRELYPIAIILTAKGHEYAHSNILLKCDSKNAVLALINKDIRNARTHNLVIYICELAMKYRFWFHADYIKGTNNEMADALSRMQIHKFKQLARRAGLKLDPAPMLFERIPFDFGTGRIFTKFQPLQYKDSTNKSCN